MNRAIQVGRYFLAAAFLVSIGAKPAEALMVTPARQEVTLKAGTGVKGHVEVYNETSERLTVEPSTKDWFVLEDNKKFTVKDWLKINATKPFVLKPGEKRKVGIHVKCPKGAVGEWVGMVSFLYKKDEPSMVTPIISVSVYAAVQGTEKVSGEITEMVVRYWQGNLQGAVAVRSTGNVHLRPVGTILLRSEDGQTASTMPIAEAGPAYPGRTQSYFGGDPGKKLAPGRYTMVVDLDSRGIRLMGEKPFTVSVDGQIKMEGDKR